ncbi:uncharacterized protein snapc2 isoform 2-T2 [Pholidichthys leucotaenia]
MKPAARSTRSKAVRPWVRLEAEPSSGGRWRLAERRTLLRALKSLRRRNAADVDYAVLRKTLRSRSVSEMLMVSSTEPCTLRNADPPQVHGPPTRQRPVGRTGPLRPLGGLSAPGFPPTVPGRSPPSSTGGQPSGSVVPVPVSGMCGSGTPCVTVSTSAVTTSSRLSGSTQPRPLSATATTGPAPGGSSSVAVDSRTGPRLLQEDLVTISTISVTSSASHTTLPEPVTAVPAGASSRSPTDGASCAPHAPTVELHPSTGGSSKTKDSPRTFGVKYVVDFERIYNFLSVMAKSSDGCQLNPMESAVVLDLLMSLPEEIPLLDCNRLHQHVIQVYQCLSAPADSKRAKNQFQDLKDRLGVETTTQRVQEHNQTVEDADSSSEAKNAEKTCSQSSQRQNCHVTGLCLPLNPFLVPLKLLQRTFS